MDRNRAVCSAAMAPPPLMWRPAPLPPARTACTYRRHLACSFPDTQRVGSVVRTKGVRNISAFDVRRGGRTLPRVTSVRAAETDRRCRHRRRLNHHSPASPARTRGSGHPRSLSPGRCPRRRRRSPAQSGCSSRGLAERPPRARRGRSKEPERYDATVELQWATYYDAADQAGQSRIWGGIHVRQDDFGGRTIGSEIGMRAVVLASTYFDGSAE